MTPHALHVLLSLIDGELDGDGIILDVQERTGGDVRLRTGTLYTILRRLVEDGLITETEPRVLDAADERRRYYAHTPLGLAVTKAEAVRLDRLVRLARDKRVLPAVRPAHSRGSHRGVEPLNSRRFGPRGAPKWCAAGGAYCSGRML